MVDWDGLDMWNIKIRELQSFKIWFEFQSDDSDSIWCDSDSLIRIFKSAAPAVIPQTTLTVQQKTWTVAP